jgi:hypothetical protein
LIKKSSGVIFEKEAAIIPVLFQDAFEQILGL